MKYLILGFILLISSYLSAQNVYTINADSVKITNCDSAELIIQNHSQGIPGCLFNTGNGRTAFRRMLQQVDDTTYLIGADTLHTLRLGYWAPNGTAIYNTNPGFVGINQPNPAATLDVGGVINASRFYNIGGQTVLQDSATNLLVGFNSGSNTNYNGQQFNTIIGENAGSSATINGSSVLVGTQAGQSSSGQANTSIGAQAGAVTPGDNNLNAGYFAGAVSSGSQNTYLGVEAGTTGTGDYNTSLGYYSTSDFQGTDNTMMGEYAGSDLVGNANVGIGSYAGEYGYGNANTSVGYWANADGPTGSNNVSLGYFSSWYLITGSHNLFAGDSVVGPSFGNYNTWLGAWAGNPLPDTSGGIGGDVVTRFDAGNHNEFDGVTLLGGKTVANAQGLSDATAVGYQAIVSTSNTMVFGDSAVTTWLFNSNAPTVSGAALVVGNNSSNGNGAYLSTGGVWTNASDRNKKENFQALDHNDLLARIDQLPVTRWNYKGLHEQHIGPVAQDFYRIFHVGSDDKTISTIDPSGIALAGIQALHQKVRDQQSEIDSLRNDVQQVLGKLNELEAALKPSSSTDQAYAKSPNQ